MSYEAYKHLLDLPYTEGDQDCYGLVRKYYRDLYDLELRNYARPIDFAFSGRDLIQENFTEEGFDIVDISIDRAEVGDGLLFRLNGSHLINHVGVFAGNNYILHHLYDRKSCEEPISRFWKKKLVSIVRHPAVSEKNRETPVQTLNLLNVIPDHVLKAIAS